MNKERLENAKRIFLFALYADIAVTALVISSDFWGVSVLRDISSGRISADPSTISWLEFWDSFALVMLLTIFGVGFGLSKWLINCYSYAKEVIGARGFKHEKWAMSAWVIPFLNLFKPYQVINEIYKAGSLTYVSPDGWKSQRGSGLLLTWWIFWAVTHLVGWMVGKILFKNALRTDMNLSQTIGSIEFHAWFCIVFGVVSVLWIFVANALTSRLLGRNVISEQLPNADLAVLATQQHEAQNLNVKPPLSTQTVSSSHRRIDSLSPKNSVRSEGLAVPLAGAVGQVSEEDHWAIALAELENGQRRPGIWARAFAEAEGDETKAKVAYLKVRAQQLSELAEQILREQQAAQQDAEVKAQSEAREKKRVLADLISTFENAEDISNEQLTLLVSTAAKADLISIRQNRAGNTLLHVCAERGLVKDVHALLAAGADPALSNNSGVRPEFLTKNRHILDLLNGLKVTSDQLEILIKPTVGLCPNCGDVVKLDVSNCPSCLAMFGPLSPHKLNVMSSSEAIVALKFAYASGKKPTENQVIYLVEAAKNDKSLVTMVDQGRHGANLLHWCAHFNLIDQAKLLLQLGANARFKSANFTMPYEWCAAGVLRRLLESAALGL
jgi:hypothetical protein